MGWREDFRLWLLGQGKSERTAKAYVLDAGRFAEWYEAAGGEVFEPQRLTTVDLQDWRRFSLGVERVSPATWNRRRAALRVFARWAMEAGLLAYDPTAGLEKAQEQAHAPRWLSRAEARRVERAAERAMHAARAMGLDGAFRRAVRSRAGLLLMLKAGLRVGEVVRLRWEDVILRPRSGFVRVLGKGSKRRRVPLTADVRAALALWREVSGRGEGLVFDISAHQWGLAVRALGEAAGLERRLTPHMLRHTFAKVMVDSGRPLTEVQQLLGHSRLDVTAVYVRPSEQDLAQAVEAVWG